MQDLTPEQLSDAMKKAIEAELPNAQAEVQALSPGHYEIKVVCAAFAEQSRVKQQQMVYGAINHFIVGANAPVHAIDRMDTQVPS